MASYFKVGVLGSILERDVAREEKVHKQNNNRPQTDLPNLHDACALALSSLLLRLLPAQISEWVS